VPAAEVALEAPCADRASLLMTVATLVERARREVPPGQVVGGLRLLLTLENGATWECARTLHQPTLESGALRAALEPTLLRETLAAAVIGARLELCDLGPPAPLQPALFGDRGAARLALAAATRGLRARFGASPLQRVVVLDPRHRLPERRYALVEAS
jgi:hypothetical protein